MHEVNGKIKTERAEYDFYATMPKDVEIIIEKENIKNKKILEPCAGNGHISTTLLDYNNTVTSNDLIKREYGLEYNCDFLSGGVPKDNYDIVLTNPPFKLITEFILKSFEYASKVIIFARLQLLESIDRYEKLFKNGYLTKVYVFSRRTATMKNGDIKEAKSSTMCFA
jgi:tRNA1(Val) A37 N6-methylase TrmN6